MWDMPDVWMDSTIGAVLVMTAKNAPSPLVTFPATSSATKILTITASGEAFRSMAPCGFPRMSQEAGLPTASDIGSGSSHGDGLGLRMSRGASRHSTTADG